MTEKGKTENVRMTGHPVFDSNRERQCFFFRHSVIPSLRYSVIPSFRYFLIANPLFFVYLFSNLKKRV